MREVTFRDFAAFANRRGHTPESLVERFKGKIEQPAEFFHRVMNPKHGDKVVPYRSVIEFCLEQSQRADSKPKHITCACGCGLEVFDRKKWVSPGCKKRVQRNTRRAAA